MKKLATALVLSFVATLLYVSFFDISGAEHIMQSVLRMRVIASSDSEQDQELKLAVRDRILKSAPAIFKDCSTLEEAAAAAHEKLTEIKSLAEDTIKELGYEYPVDVEVKKQFFPTREYGDFTFPAGEYDTLTVTIGEGKGQNWWCVMFPPLCFVDMANNTPHAQEDLMAVLSEEEVNMLLAEKNPPIILKSKILELFEKTRNFIANKLAKLN